MHKSPSASPNISKSEDFEENKEIVDNNIVNEKNGIPSESQMVIKPWELSTSETSISPDSLQIQDCSSSLEGLVPPMQALGDALTGTLILGDEESSQSKGLDIEGALVTAKKETTREGFAKRPQDLPTVADVSSANSTYGAEPAPLLGRKTSSPLSFVPLKPERTASVPSPPELDASLTSASSISASYHEDMAQASFETYARQNSERSKSETPSPGLEKGRKSFYKTPDSSDDFYSKYQKDASCYSLDDIYSPTQGNSIEDALDYSSAIINSTPASKPLDKGSPSTSAERPKKLVLVDAETDATDVMYQFSDTWTEMLAPGNLQSMCVTDRHVWVVDKSDRLHYSALSGPGLTWRKVCYFLYYDYYCV